MSTDQDVAVSISPTPEPDAAWEEHGRDQFAYQMIMARSVQTNGLLWQTPSLALTAQAFLLTLSLGHDTIRPIRIAVSLLGLVIGFMSMHLMAKHHYYYELDQASLRKLETGLALPPIAHRDRQIATHRGVVWALPTVKVTSYVVWQGGIFLVGLTNAIVLLLVLTRPGLLN